MINRNSSYIRGVLVTFIFVMFFSAYRVGICRQQRKIPINVDKLYFVLRHLSKEDNKLTEFYYLINKNNIIGKMKTVTKDVFGNRKVFRKEAVIDTIEREDFSENGLLKVLNYNCFLDIPDYINCYYTKNVDSKTTTEYKLKYIYKGKSYYKKVKIEDIDDLILMKKSTNILKLKFIKLYIESLENRVFRAPKNGAQSGEEIGFTYDGEHRLTKIEYPDISIDMKQEGTDTITRVANVTPTGQKTPQAKEIRSHNVLVNGQLLCKYGSGPDAGSNSQGSGKNTGSQQYYHYDHNNNLAIITDEHGNVTHRNLMDAYGNVLPLPDSTHPTGAKSLLTNLLTGGAGVIYIGRARMYNMRRRFYRNAVRRFISQDPIHSMKYQYSDNNPISFSDSTGLTSEPSVNYGSFDLFKGYRNRVFNYVKDVVSYTTPIVRSSRCISAFEQYGPDFSLSGGVHKAVLGFWSNAKISFLYGDQEELDSGSTQYIYEGGFAYAPIERNIFNKIVLQIDFISATFGSYKSPYAYNINTFRTAANIIIHELAHLTGVPGMWLDKNKEPWKFNELYHFCCELISWECMGMKPEQRTWIHGSYPNYTIEWMEKIIGIDNIVRRLPIDLQTTFKSKWKDYKAENKNQHKKSPNLYDRRKFYGKGESKIGATSLKHGKKCCRQLKRIRWASPYDWKSGPAF
ncbi:MAG: hypothetical protein K8T10_03370 [Candidatus Eremiobacteraeota bacterium]|nr:hypothetical protein [Candidatus Eremiobacteraeota bacterium]